VLEPAHRGCRDAGRGGGRLARAARPHPDDDPLAVHRAGCADQAAEPLPEVSQYSLTKH